MKEFVWSIVKGVAKGIKNVCIILFFLWMGSSIINLQNDVSIVRKQSTDSYNIQAQVYTKVADAITAIYNYSQSVEQNSIGRDRAITAYIQQNNEKPEYKYMKSMIVYLVEQSLIDEHKGSIGTGTVIKVTENETYIITNKHVCDWAEGTTCFVYQDKEKYTISLVKANEVDHDIQIVKTSKVVPDKVAVKGLKDVKEQDTVYMVGNNNGNPFMYSEGTVSGFDRGTGDMLVGMPSGPGNSGSGIFTKDGYLCGLLYAGQIFNLGFFPSLDTAHGICVNSEILRLFLAEYIN
jgi:S1-C subfamily serine protease